MLAEGTAALCPAPNPVLCVTSTRLLLSCVLHTKPATVTCSPSLHSSRSSQSPNLRGEVVETPIFVVGQAEVWVARGPRLRLVSKVGQSVGLSCANSR